MAVAEGFVAIRIFTFCLVSRYQAMDANIAGTPWNS